MADLFRKNALDSISKPEHLDRQVRIVRPASWVIGIILLLGLITFVLWSFTYHISNGINMQGVLFTQNNIKTVKADRECIITDVFVKEGDIVYWGDIIAKVSCDEMLDEISEKADELSRLEEGTEEYKACEEELNTLRDDYSEMTVISSPGFGYVQSVKSMGESLNTGDVICSFVDAGGYLEVVAYVPLHTANNLQTGMKAQISPVYAPREEYGYMSGTITQITNTPVSKESIIKKMDTLSYVENILPDTACVEVHINLDADSNSQNSFHWSNPKGEKLMVNVGTQCNIIAVTDEYRPIELLF